MGSLNCTTRPSRDFSIEGELSSLTCSGPRASGDLRDAVKRRMRRRWHRRQRLPEPKEVPFVHSLLVDIHLRTAWALVGGNESMASFCALSLTCFDMWARLQDDAHHLLWTWKSKAILGSDVLFNDVPLPVKKSIAPRILCVSLYAAWRLISRALCSCDWLALVDVSVLLVAIGVTDARPLLIVLRALLSRRLRGGAPSAQALHWLWDLASGTAAPWTAEMTRTATTDVLELDVLRDWLHTNVSEHIRTWQDLSEVQYGYSYSGLFPEPLQEHLQYHARLCACFALLATECDARAPHEGLADLVSVREIASGVEVIFNAAEEEGDPQLWSLVLLLLICGLRAHLEFPEQYRKDPSCSEEDGSWQGIIFSWRQGGTEELVKPLQILHFPKLCVDKRKGWLHTQHGIQKPLASDDGSEYSPVTVQLDARLGSNSATYLGHWIEHGESRPSPALVFTIVSGYGGLQRWMDPSDPCIDPGIESADAATNTREIFGIVGEKADDECLRCFHLARKS